MKFMPSEFRLVEARQPPLKDQCDEWLARVVCYANAVAAPGEWAHDATAAGETSAPRTIEALRRDPDAVAALAEGAVFVGAPLVIESGRPVKASISLDQGLLDATDAAAKRSGLMRSAFLSSAARENRGLRLTRACELWRFARAGRLTCPRIPWTIRSSIYSPGGTPGEGSRRFSQPAVSTIRGEWPFVVP